jgi:hypothetical protein
MTVRSRTGGMMRQFENDIGDILNLFKDGYYDEKEAVMQVEKLILDSLGLDCYLSERHKEIADEICGRAERKSLPKRKV